MKTLRSRYVDICKERGLQFFSPRVDLYPDLIVFLVCFCFLAGALLLTPPDPGSPFVKLGRLPMPSLCTLKNLTGLPCPGCGLARSITAAAHGDLLSSMAYHRLGCLTLAYILLQFVYRLGLLLIPVWRSRLEHNGKFLNQGIVVLAVLLVLNWMLTLTSGMLPGL